MKILLGCTSVNGLGGSEMYHYELAKELTLQGNDLTLFTLRKIEYSDPLREKLSEMKIKQIDLTTFVPDTYDIIVASQPEVNKFLIERIQETPVISIIHSEVRAEDPLIHPRIVHYVCIRQPITDLLVNHYKIPQEKVSLIYNPIDKTRFNQEGLNKTGKLTGLFIGGAKDNLRVNTLYHIVSQCIENDWDLWIMSYDKLSYTHPNIKYIPPCMETEYYVKQVDFTVGILMGRTTLEGWCCGVPGYMYIVNPYGEILSIETEEPSSITELCESKYVASQHLELYKKFI